MRRVVKNEYAELQCSSSGDAVYLKWFPPNERMSESEFIELIDLLFSTIEVFNSRVLYVDALHFNYYISEKVTQTIKLYLESCEIKSLDIVMSENLLGKNSIQQLIKQIKSIESALHVYESCDEGAFWFSLKSYSTPVKFQPESSLSQIE